MGKIEVKSTGKFIEHRAAIFKGIMRSRVGSNGLIMQKAGWS